MNRILIQEMTVQELAALEKEWLQQGIEIGMKMAKEDLWCDHDEAMSILGIKDNSTLWRRRTEANSPIKFRPKGRNYEYLKSSLEAYKNRAKTTAKK